MAFLKNRNTFCEILRCQIFLLEKTCSGEVLFASLSSDLLWLLRNRFNEIQSHKESVCGQMKVRKCDSQNTVTTVNHAKLGSKH